MKKVISLAVVIFLWTLAPGCVRGTWTDSSSWIVSEADLTATTRRTESGEIQADLKLLEVENQSGSVRIVGSNTGEPNWSWTLTVRARTDASAKEAADAARCTARREGDRLRLIVALPASRNEHRFQSDLEIRVPKSLSVTARNRFGQTEITGLQGEIQVTSESGAVAIGDIGGSVRAQTTFATLTVRAVGPASLKNQSGRIEARDIRGPLEAETSFGTLVAREIAGLAHLRNRSGAIEAVRIQGPLDAATSFASLVAREIGGPVQLRNQSGPVEAVRIQGDAEITTSFATLSARGISGRATLVNQSGRIEGAEISGSVKANTSFSGLDVAGSGPDFTCHNQSGSIRLRASSPALTRIDAKTSFGLLELRLPATLKPAIQARTTFGKVESDFPIPAEPRTANALAESEPDVPRITLENQSGDIRIARD